MTRKSLIAQYIVALFSVASATSLFEPLADLSPLKSFSNPRSLVQEFKTKGKTQEFSILQSPSNADYELRIKSVDPSKLGIDTVKQYSGYLDYKNSKHFFYWFFESRNDPKNDPIILWLNGGPGCSSFTGLFFELGPSSISPELKPIYNPHSWNNNASVIFLEQPIGVGFSYGDDKVTTTQAAGEDVYNFLELFFLNFPSLRSNNFHIAGESYAGHYIPQIAHEIAIVHEADATFNLTSVLIGNGITDPLVQYDYYRPMACGEGGHRPVISPEECEKMDKQAPRCRFLSEGCYSTGLTFSCIVAGAYCENMAMNAYSKTGLNVYDIRGKCETDEDLCYAAMGDIEKYLNQPEVQTALGSDVSHYEGCNNDVFASFLLTGDGGRPFQQYVSEILNKDIPVLIYAGDKDYICNWLGNLAWTNELEWKNNEEYRFLPLAHWKNEETGEVAGEVKNYGSLTFLRVYDAGHMVPYNQPENSLEMVNRWIRGDYSLGY